MSNLENMIHNSVLQNGRHLIHRNFTSKYSKSMFAYRGINHSNDLKSRTWTWSTCTKNTNRVSWVIEQPKFRPTIQCQVPPNSSSDFFLIYAAISYEYWLPRKTRGDQVHTFSTWCLSIASLIRRRAVFAISSVTSDRWTLIYDRRKISLLNRLKVAR